MLKLRKLPRKAAVQAIDYVNLALGRKRAIEVARIIPRYGWPFGHIKEISSYIYDIAQADRKLLRENLNTLGDFFLFPKRGLRKAAALRDQAKRNREKKTEDVKQAEKKYSPPREKDITGMMFR